MHATAGHGDGVHTHTHVIIIAGHLAVSIVQKKNKIIIEQIHHSWFFSFFSLPFHLYHSSVRTIDGSVCLCARSYHLKWHKLTANTVSDTMNSVSYSWDVRSRMCVKRTAAHNLHSAIPWHSIMLYTGDMPTVCSLSSIKTGRMGKSLKSKSSGRVQDKSIFFPPRNGYRYDWHVVKAHTISATCHSFHFRLLFLMLILVFFHVIADDFEVNS